MPELSFQKSFRKFKASLCDKYVIEDPQIVIDYINNTIGLERSIFGVLKPCSTSEVQEIVLAANRYKIPLFPISCGLNWGYGSKLPVRDGCVILDLSGMRSIRNADSISVTKNYAIVEPGVTQGDLYALIEERGLPLFFNVTGAGPDTSILGNSLDRGCGYFGIRQENLSGLEVVLGNGEILRTGYGHFQDGVQNAYRYGIGPDLEGLFFQSNFGVVTAATFELFLKRERHAALVVKMKPEALFEKFIDVLGCLRKTGVVESVLHIGSPGRSRITLEPVIYHYLLKSGFSPGEETKKRAVELLSSHSLSGWTAAGGIYGTPSAVDDTVRVARDMVSEVAEVSVLEPGIGGGEDVSDPVIRGAFSAAVQPLVDLCLGRPSRAAVYSASWALGELPEEGALDLDDTGLGLLFCCPSMSLDGGVAKSVKDRAEKVFQKFGLEPYMTFNIVNERAMVLVLNLVFRRNKKGERLRAYNCVEDLYLEWEKIGIYPYRLPVNSMARFVREGDIFWEAVKDLKRTFDPNHIIAPGRYNMI